MTNKMKLVPEVPTDEMCLAGHNTLAESLGESEMSDRDREDEEKAYKAMTSECQTVEIVDLKVVMFDFIYSCGDDRSFQHFEKYLTENGYQIIRKVEG